MKSVNKSELPTTKQKDCAKLKFWVQSWTPHIMLLSRLTSEITFPNFNIMLDSSSEFIFLNMCQKCSSMKITSHYFYLKIDHCVVVILNWNGWKKIANFGEIILIIWQFTAFEFGISLLYVNSINFALEYNWVNLYSIYFTSDST